MQNPTQADIIAAFAGVAPEPLHANVEYLTEIAGVLHPVRPAYKRVGRVLGVTTEPNTTHTARRFFEKRGFKTWKRQKVESLHSS